MPSINTLCTQAVENAMAAKAAIAKAPSPLLLSPAKELPPSSRPQRTRKLTAKQASQESQERRRAIEKAAKLKKKPRINDPSQLVDGIEVVVDNQ
jgi:hypothetical protein